VKSNLAKKRENELRRGRELLEEMRINSIKCKPYIWKDDPETIRKSLKYRLCREKVLERDRYICQMCKGKKQMQVHHILPIKKFPLHIFNLRNIITLCMDCHHSICNKEYLYEELFFTYTDTLYM